ncbi:MAG: hypothetical protein M5U10_00095 [Candidatus Methanoperedens sp.]|nr:hypothetical protein [Candidatus Methanoperedens nitroreducens]MDJ1420295.1 hypothetical protein [Candidatus Methanoperedens sp.]
MEKESGRSLQNYGILASLSEKAKRTISQFKENQKEGTDRKTDEFY